MDTAPTIEKRYAVPTGSETQFWLHNRFDESCPPGWEDEAIKRIYADWVAEDAREADMPESSNFWSRVSITAVVLIAVAWVAMSWH
jgi:hypothetical protein